MTRLFSILTTEADAGGGGLLQFLPIILLAVCGVILLISFIVGCKKGGKRVSWAGLVWLGASLVYGFLYWLLGDAVSEVMYDTLANIAGGFGVEGESLTNLVDGLAIFVPAILIATGVIAVVMILYGIFSIALRPKIKMIPKNADAYVMDEDGVEYDEDIEDYDDYEQYASRRMPLRLNHETPGVGTRLAGGIICLINALTVIVTILALGVFLLNATSLKEGALSFMFEFKLGKITPVPLLVKYASKFALDSFFIGILIAFICKGRRTGLSGALHGIIKYVGLALVIMSFYLPFSKFSDEGGVVLLSGLTTRCIDASTNIFGAGSLGWLAPIVGRIFAGLLMAILVIVITCVLNWVLGKVVKWSFTHPVARAIDGTIAGIIYFVIGLFVCILVWALWYLLARYGIFNVQELFTSDAGLSNGLFKTMGGVIEPLLVRIDQMLGFVPAA